MRRSRLQVAPCRKVSPAATQTFSFSVVPRIYIYCTTAGSCPVGGERGAGGAGREEECPDQPSGPMQKLSRKRSATTSWIPSWTVCLLTTAHGWRRRAKLCGPLFSGKLCQNRSGRVYDGPELTSSSVAFREMYESETDSNVQNFRCTGFHSSQECVLLVVKGVRITFSPIERARPAWERRDFLARLER